MQLPINTAILLAMLVGLAVDLFLLGFLYTLRNKWPKGTPLPPHAGLVSLIAEEDGYPSLARLQLLVWTLVVIFAFVTLSMVRIFSGVPGSPTLSTNVLELLGINGASPVVSAGLSRDKYSTVAEASDPSQKKTLQYHPLYTMLQENDGFSNTRFQMLSWTIVSLVIFVSALFYLLSNPPTDLTTLNPPDVSSTLVTLTGISQGVYLFGKGVSEPDPRKPSGPTPTNVVCVAMAVSYLVVAGGNPAAPVFHYVLKGVSKSLTLTKIVKSVSVDARSAWSVTPNPLSGSSSSQQWYSMQPLTGTASATNVQFLFQHQYYLTTLVSGPGTVTPTSGWYNSGQKVTITAKANTGHRFKSWTGSGTGSHTGTSPSHTMTMNTAVTETATFT